MRGFVWLGLGVLLFLAWAISYFVFHVAGVPNSFASDFCAHTIHDLRVHRKSRSRIMVGFARDEIEVDLESLLDEPSAISPPL
jgi:hypothetical protein